MNSGLDKHKIRTHELDEKGVETIGTPCQKPQIKDTFDWAIDEMVSKGILWPEALAQFEKLFIVRVLQEAGGKLNLAAKIMGVHRNTLSQKIRLYSINAGRGKRR